MPITTRAARKWSLIFKEILIEEATTVADDKDSFVYYICIYVAFGKSRHHT